MNDAITAAENRVVLFHYTLRDGDGREVESSRKGEPTAALMGHGSLLAGLEQALQGRAAGERFEITLDADAAFGARRDDWTQRVSKKYVPNAARLKPGMQTRLQTDAGPRVATVLKVGGKFIDVDLNHPLAGVTVTFDVDVIEVREATQEELSHGHVHGVGGHHH